MIDDIFGFLQFDQYAPYIIAAYTLGLGCLSCLSCILLRNWYKARFPKSTHAQKKP